MEQEQEQELENLEETTSKKPAKSSFNPKILIFGLPAFALQLIVVYFITANILLKKMEGKVNSDENLHVENITEAVEDEEQNSLNNNFGEHIFQIDDIIVNPANTSGSQLLLSSIAFDVPEDRVIKDLEKRQILVKDIIISVLSSKTINQLSDNTYRDSLRVEISNNIQNKLSDIKINRVYFSKFIIN